MGNYKVLEYYLLIIFILIYIWLVIFILNYQIEKGLLFFLSTLSSILVLFTILNILISGSIHYKAKATDNTDNKELVMKNPPSIYYLIVDSYARNDVLKNIYGFNNDRFINFLHVKGFFVGKKSTANYHETMLSIASSLNMCYLDSLIKAAGKESEDRILIKEMVLNNKVMRFLKNYGYKTISFNSQYPLINMNNVDLFITLRLPLDEFRLSIINLTPFRILLKSFSRSNPYRLHGESIISIFNNLRKLTDFEYPKFVFAHILAPHSPFVFNKNGLKEEFEDIPFSLNDGPQQSDIKKYIEDYINQLTFINEKLIVLINHIIEKEPGAIIILQSDHGPASSLDCKSHEYINILERISILNAIYLPDQSYTSLYDSITPVNTFRYILNRYFNGDSALLEDDSYISTSNKPFNVNKIDKTLIR
ncbi:MAG: sulfatase-like hydrolase/transferase [Candidatus Thorarchaeota archaeon]